MDSKAETSATATNTTQSHVHKRKFRATNDFVSEELTDVPAAKHSKHKEKRRNYSYLPKIDDVTLTSYSLSSRQLSPSKIKILNNFKLYKRRLEVKQVTPSIVPIERLKLKKAKGVWTPVKSTSENMKRELFVSLIPLENTNLLTKCQLKQLMCGTVNDQDTKDDLKDFYRPCSVFLRRMTLEEINFELNRNSAPISFLAHNDSFLPRVTSSPNIAKNFIDQQSWKTEGSTSRNLELTGDQEQPQNDTVIVINSTFEMTEDLRKTLTQLNLSLTGNVNNENIDQSPNCTYEIGQTPDQKKTPKCVLKTNMKTPNNNNRRVTFNDTSVIIMHDSDTLYVSRTPTQFADDNRRSSLLHLKSLTGKSLENRSHLKSANKEGFRKAKPMPNFAKMHKRMFDGMLDIKQHTEEKMKRSQLLLSGHKPTASGKKIDHINNITNNLKKQSLKVLMSNSMPTKKKLDYKEKPKNLAIRKQEAIVLANKIRPGQVNPKQDNKVIIKGIRSNRRFELLMSLRKGQQKK